MLKPRKLKYRKYQKSPGIGSCIQLMEPNTFGLKCLESGRLSSSQIESVRKDIRRKLKKQGNLVIGVFPDLPVSSKPAEVRMGKGKGSVDF
jgi:large subunit ribosomal protein L16